MNRSPKVALITLTNNGYIDYTLNCLQSLKKLGFRDKIKVYAIGRRAYYSFLIRGYDATLIKNKDAQGFEQFRKGNWANVTYYKFEIISENLNNYDYVFYSDGDIVFKDIEFANYCLENIKYYDLLIQNDKQSDDDDGQLCSGFMLIRSNERSRHFFHPDSVRSEIKLGWDDQIYVNKEKKSIKYNKLPLNRFPNGRYYKSNLKNIEPYMIHFNFAIGHKKARDIIKRGESQSLYTNLRFRMLGKSGRGKRVN